MNRSNTHIIMGYLRVTLNNMRVWLLNLWRQRVRRYRLDYVLLTLSGNLPEYAPTPSLVQRLLGRTPGSSLFALRHRLQRIADDPRAVGVVLVMEEFTPDAACAESLRRVIKQFRARDKQVIAYLIDGTTAAYSVACVADRVYMPPTAYLSILGVGAEVIFVRDGLALLGIEAEVTAVSPYKAAGDIFTRSEPSPESRAQLERLLDTRYNRLVTTIAAARDLLPAAVQTLIDRAPLSAREAREAGLIDGVYYEDELKYVLRTGNGSQRNGSQSNDDAATPVPIVRWNKARRMLRLPYARHEKQTVAVIGVEGTITRSGDSDLPLPVAGSAQADSDSVTRLLDMAADDRRIAAVVLYINSPGGDSFASDLIWRAVRNLNAKKPVIVSMGGVAASGGYYVACAAHTVVALPTTVTGSIGVLSIRPNVQGLLQRGGIRPFTLARGARQGLYDIARPLSAEDRAALQKVVAQIYADFKQRVCDARNLTDAELEPIAGGRVWTGDEALQRKLVDELGDLPTAIQRARQLVDLPTDMPIPPFTWLSIPRQRRSLLPFLQGRLAGVGATPGGGVVSLYHVARHWLRPRMLLHMPWVLTEAGADTGATMDVVDHLYRFSEGSTPYEDT